MAITTENGLVAALSGQRPPFHKVSVAGKGAGSWHSPWTVPGQPAAGRIDERTLVIRVRGR